MSKTKQDDTNIQLCRNSLVMSVTSSLLHLITGRIRTNPDFSLSALSDMSRIPPKRLEQLFLLGLHGTITLNEISDIALAMECEIRFSVMSNDYL